MPHLGNFAGSVFPAELFHRYLDAKGVENEFICGGDVHGTPFELEALERDEDPENIKDEQVEKVRNAYESLDVDFSIFSDTHSDYNRRQTHDMFVELYTKGLIDEETQNIAYCQDDERFLPDRYIEGECPHCGGLARGDQCDDCGKLVEPENIENPECQVCGGHNIEFRDTDHLFLDLTRFKQEIETWVEEESPVPDSMKKQVLHDLEEAEKRSITRDQDWGFPIPVGRVNERIEEEDLDVEKLDPEKYEDKVLYVWFDAPIGYIGFTRELFEDDEEWKEYWDEDAEVYYSMGKDNAIFHTVIWPTMLLGSSNDEIEYALPEYIFLQNYLMWEEGAFSKSRDRGVFIDEAIDYYPSDYWRFYIAKMLPTDQDTNFSWSDFESEINNVLNDTIGNYVNRVLTLSENWFDSRVPETELRDRDTQVLERAEGLVDESAEHFEEHDLRKALEKAVEIARLGDQYLSEEEPWNNEDIKGEVLETALSIVRGLSVALYPFIPGSAENIAEMLDEEIEFQGEKDIYERPLKFETRELGEKEILFEKIDTHEQQEDTMTHDYNEDTVSFEQFQEMDIRTGKVEKVEDHPNADRLYRVQVNVGDATLQTCAGLVDHYSKEELEGRTVVVLANLEPTELRGEKSECMMLAAEDDDGTVALLQPEKEVGTGSEVL